MDQETQDKLDKLEKMEKAGRERARKYIEKVREGGRMQISAIISKEAYNEICRRRDAALLQGAKATTGTVIESLLLANVNANVSIDIKPEPKEPEYSLFDDLEPKATDTPAQKPMPEVKPQKPEEIEYDPWGMPIELPTYHGKTISVEDRDKVVIKVAALITGKDSAQRRADALNKAGVSTKGGEPWTAKKVSDAIYLAKKRAQK